MHELGLCKSIIEIIQQKALDTQCTKVKKIILEIGQLASIDNDALRFSFALATKGTVLQGAVLEIIEIPGEAFCSSCQKRGPLQRYYDGCVTCGGHALEIVQGEELRVQSMVGE